MQNMCDFTALKNAVIFCTTSDVEDFFKYSFHQKLNILCFFIWHKHTLDIVTIYP